MEPNFITKDISEIDMSSAFFHYTNHSNLKNIYEKGLESRIGKNSLYVEETPKIFFAIGEIGIITIMDVWLRWLASKENMPKFIYWIGTYYMRSPFCIKQVPNAVVKHNLNNKRIRKKIYHQMNKILDTSVFLILDLEENIDFSYFDIDEVKNSYYKSFLQLLYPKNSNLKEAKIEYWNMHTYSNKIINPNKIAILSDKNNISANNIVKKLIEKNITYVKLNCDFLYEYYHYIYQKK